MHGNVARLGFESSFRIAASGLVLVGGINRGLRGIVSSGGVPMDNGFFSPLGPGWCNALFGEFAGELF